MSLFLGALILLMLSCVFTPLVLGRLFWPGAAYVKARHRVLLAAIPACALIVATYGWIVSSGVYGLDSRFWGWLYNASGLLFMAHVYLSFCALILGLVLFGRGLRSEGAKRWTGVAALALSFGAVLLGWHNAQQFDLSHQTLKVAGLERPLRFAHIPDVHLGQQRDVAWLRAILSAVAEEKPDFILYNGDFFDSNVALKPELFETLASVRTPQFFTTGNHEHYIYLDSVLQQLRSAGVRVLSSETVSIGGINLVGLEYMNADQHSRDPHSVNQLYMNVELPKIQVDRSKPVVLAHHSPVGLSYAADYGAQVYLAGHTHAGQVFPATLLVGLNFPFYKGTRDFRGMKVVVSEGAGTFGPWMRLGSRNEVQIITLVPAD